LKINLIEFKARGLKSDEFKSAGLHDNRAVEPWKTINHFSICLTIWENHENLEEVWRTFLTARVKTV
jgi:hypothetical protein